MNEPTRDDLIAENEELKRRCEERFEQLAKMGQALQYGIAFCSGIGDSKTVERIMMDAFPQDWNQLSHCLEEKTRLIETVTELKQELQKANDDTGALDSQVFVLKAKMQVAIDRIIAVERILSGCSLDENQTETWGRLRKERPVEFSRDECLHIDRETHPRQHKCMGDKLCMSVARSCVVCGHMFHCRRCSGEPRF